MKKSFCYLVEKKNEKWEKLKGRWRLVLGKEKTISSTIFECENEIEHQIAYLYENW